MSQLGSNKCGVVCEWMQSKRVIINPDGQVVPCCFIANVLYLMDKTGSVEELEKNRDDIRDQVYRKDLVKREFIADPTLAIYYENKQLFNAHNRPVGEILADDWFTKTLPDSWDDSDKISQQCWWNCSSDGKSSGKVSAGLYHYRKKK